jgi:hypothetical protein
VRQQRVHQRVLLVACAGMHDEARAREKLGRATARKRSSRKPESFRSTSSLIIAGPPATRPRSERFLFCETEC